MSKYVVSLESNQMLYFGLVSSVPLERVYAGERRRVYLLTTRTVAQSGKAKDMGNWNSMSITNHDHGSWGHT